jgi:hypothetical protein
MDLLEDMEDEPNLHHLYNIMKNIGERRILITSHQSRAHFRLVLLNDSAIFEHITQDDLVVSVVAMFESTLEMILRLHYLTFYSR